ncbi:MAG: hypothetical protein ACK5CL_01305 [Sphingomonadales bacterium]
MNVSWIQKYSLNLGWFLLVLGGISLLDRGLWLYPGLLLLFCGLLNMYNTLRMAYLGKNAWMLSAGNIYLVNMAGLLLIAMGHVFSAKKEISLELLVFLALCIVFLWVGKVRSQNLQPAKTGKSSAKR